MPLKNIGPLGNLDNREVLNVNETYFVGLTRGGRRSQSPVWAVRAESGARLFTKPYDYVGEKSFPGGYEAYLRSLSGNGQIYHDVRFEQCPEGARAGAGVRRAAQGQLLDRARRDLRPGELRAAGRGDAG